jgi:hypothetical protein
MKTHGAHPGRRRNGLHRVTAGRRAPRRRARGDARQPGSRTPDLAGGRMGRAGGRDWRGGRGHHRPRRNRFWPSGALVGSEAESVRFHGLRVTKMAAAVADAGAAMPQPQSVTICGHMALFDLTCGRFPFDKTTLLRPVAASLPLPLVVVLRLLTSGLSTWALSSVLRCQSACRVRPNHKTVGPGYDRSTTIGRSRGRQDSPAPRRIHG